MLKYRLLGALSDQTIPFCYEPEPIPYKIEKTKKYWPDFRVHNRRTKRYTYFETKGRFTAPDRMKILDVLKSNPGIDLRLVFQYDNKLNKNSKTRYSDWAKKHNIPYSIGVKKGIPDEWIDEFKKP